MGGVPRSLIPAHRIRNIDDKDSGSFEPHHEQGMSQMFAADIKAEVGRWKRQPTCEEPPPENEHKTALAMTAFAAETASLILNAKSTNLSALGSPDPGNRLAMRKTHEQLFFPDEDDEKVGERTKKNPRNTVAGLKRQVKT